MSFDSIAYLVFLPTVAVLYRLCPSNKRWIVLLAASIFFYASSSIPLTFLLAAVVAVSYVSGILLERAVGQNVRRAVLIAALTLCVGVLLYFKYFNFFAECAAHIFSEKWEPWNIVLPVGCSFYIFQALSYTIDVYRRDICAECHFGYFALYISFFPQLVAGPIERAGSLLPQIGAGKDVDFDDLRAGVRLLLSGSFRKIVVADFCGVFVTSVFSAMDPDGSAVFAAALLFGIQIYCDFAGYSEIAAGSARLVGVRLMRNFDRPYLSASIREFWRRWHISLSRWLADYVYIPLGGSRHGTARQILATAVVFTVSGLWHGANMTFVVWGLLHGAFVISEVLISRFFEREPRFLFPGRLLTFSAVSFSWIFFRADSLTHAAALIKCLFSRWSIAAGLECLGIGVTELAIIVLAVLSFPILYSLSSEEEGKTHRDMTFVYTMLAVAVAWLLRLEGDGASAFIYFRF